MDWFGTPLTPLAGGYSGETFLVGEDPEAVVLRIYRRHPDRAPIDASLLRLVGGIIPVPRVIDVRQASGDQPAVLVTERLRGVCLDRLLRDPPADLDWQRLATSLARVLASLSGMPFLNVGLFTDAHLGVSSEGMPTDLAEWAGMHRSSSRLASWSEADWLALQHLVDDAQELLDQADSHTSARVVLVHSDFNAKNLIVDPSTAEIAGVVDWEFAHAGSVYTDIGNLTRFERDERLLAPILQVFSERAPGHLPDALRCGRAADLWALIELAGRPAGHPIGELAARLLLAQARTGDLWAWPWSAHRVDPVAAEAVS